MRQETSPQTRPPLCVPSRPPPPPGRCSFYFFPLPRYASESDLLRELFFYPHRMFSELLGRLVGSLLRGCWGRRVKLAGLDGWSCGTPPNRRGMRL